MDRKIDNISINSEKYISPISPSKEDDWINYSDMDTNKYSSLLTALGLTSSLLTHPLTVLTTRQQAGIENTKHSGTNVFSGILDLHSRFGFKGLIRGWTALASMGIPSQLLYFNTTESSREWLQRRIRQVFPTLTSDIIDGFQSALSSIAANSVSLLAYVPADVVSSRLIVLESNSTNTLSMIKLIYKESGYKGFYAGYGPSLVVASVYSAQWWWIYSVSRRKIKYFNYFDKRNAVLDAISGLFAGVGAGIMTHPLDTIKTRIMTSTAIQKNTFIKTFDNVIKTEGTKALFRGLVPSVYVSCISSIGFAMSYEFLKVLSLN